MKKIFLLTSLFALICTLTIKAQVTIGKVTPPDSSAVLQIISPDSNKGVLIPEMDQAHRDAIKNPAEGLMIYNTTSKSFNFYSGTAWTAIGGSSPWKISGTTNPATDNAQNIYQMGKVAIGLPDTISSIVKFIVTANDKGIMIPRMTIDQRDRIPVDSLANSLMIYNTTEDCYNYYSRLEKEWQSLCGKLGKAVFEITDCSAIKVYGQYLTNQALGTSHYIKVPVTVSKAGSYSVTAVTSPDNGYYFSTSGEFLTTGNYDLILQGAGTPRNFTKTGMPGDSIKFSLNGIDAPCKNIFIKVEDSSIKPLYSLICNTVTVNGVYKVNTALDGTNTITMQLEVDPAATGATYFIETNTVDGIKFSGSGILMGGIQSVTLNGSGKPTSYVQKTLTISSNSVSDVESCFATVTISYAGKRVLSIGTYSSSYGYCFNGSAASNKLITSTSNYGVLPNSVVKVDGIKLTRSGDFAPSLAELQTALAEKPDIVTIGVWWNPSVAQAQALVDYVAKGGVLLAFMEESGTTNMLQAIFGQTSVTSSSVNGPGAVYKYPYVNDEVLNGPFGDIRGQQWGEDASNTQAISNIPGSQVTIYSYATDISGASSSGASEMVTAFKHNTLNIIFVCDGGFNSNNGGNSNTICPFVLNGSNFPIAKPNYGRGATRYSVYNSIFTANAFAWAIKQAQFNGINK